MQYLYSLNQARIDEIARRIRKTAGIELVGQRHTVNEDGDAIAANATYVDTLGPKACACGLVVDAGHVSKYVTN